jgi:hypothetical protein
VPRAEYRGGVPVTSPVTWDDVVAARRRIVLSGSNIDAATLRRVVTGEL